MKIRPLVLMAVGVCACASVQAKTLNLPEMPVEEAIGVAKKYVEDQKIDADGHYLASVEYKNVYNEYEKPFWRTQWVYPSGAKGAFFYIDVYADGTAVFRPGK